jgi:hypothetical protein
MTTNPPLLVFVYRVISDDVWDTHRIPETRLQAFIDGGWHILIGEDDIRRQMIEDEFNAQTQPFNQPRMP